MIFKRKLTKTEWAALSSFYNPSANFLYTDFLHLYYSDPLVHHRDKYNMLLKAYVSISQLFIRDEVDEVFVIKYNHILRSTNVCRFKRNVPRQLKDMEMEALRKLEQLEMRRWG